MARRTDHCFLVFPKCWTSVPTACCRSRDRGGRTGAFSGMSELDRRSDYRSDSEWDRPTSRWNIVRCPPAEKRVQRVFNQPPPTTSHCWNAGERHGCRNPDSSRGYQIPDPAQGNQQLGGCRTQQVLMSLMSLQGETLLSFFTNQDRVGLSCCSSASSPLVESNHL